MFNNLVNLWQNTPGGHSGSWFGLKDRGVTEQVGALFGAPQTGQGGSNLSSLANRPSTTVLGTQSSDPTAALNQLANQVVGGSKGSQISTNNTGGGLPANNTNNQQNVQQNFDPYSGLRNEISSGWDNYINSLNSQLEGLSNQRTAQEGIAQSQYNQGINDLNLSNTQNLAMLDKQRSEAQSNQAKTLRDLSSNIKNSFDAGNIYLGSRGAGDSSAANMYSYALTKMGTQQRSDVMNQTSKIMDEINGRETNLKNIYDTESKNLKLTYDQAVAGIAQWFSDAQNQLRQMQSQGQLSKSQDLANLSKDILNQAVSKMNALQQEVSNRRSALEQWAMGVSDNIGQLRQNMSAVAQYSPDLPGFSPVTGTPTVDSNGNMFIPRGYGSTADEKNKGLFG